MVIQCNRDLELRRSILGLYEHFPIKKGKIVVVTDSQEKSLNRAHMSIESLKKRIPRVKIQFFKVIGKSLEEEVIKALKEADLILQFSSNIELDMDQLGKRPEQLFFVEEKGENIRFLGLNTLDLGLFFEEKSHREIVELKDEKLYELIFHKKEIREEDLLKYKEKKDFYFVSLANERTFRHFLGSISRLSCKNIDFFFDDEKLSFDFLKNEEKKNFFYLRKLDIKRLEICFKGFKEQIEIQKMGRTVRFLSNYTTLNERKSLLSFSKMVLLDSKQTLSEAISLEKPFFVLEPELVNALVSLSEEKNLKDYFNSLHFDSSEELMKSFKPLFEKLKREYSAQLGIARAVFQNLAHQKHPELVLKESEVMEKFTSKKLSFESSLLEMKNILKLYKTKHFYVRQF